MKGQKARAWFLAAWLTAMAAAVLPASAWAGSGGALRDKYSSAWSDPVKTRQLRRGVAGTAWGSRGGQDAVCSLLDKE